MEMDEWKYPFFKPICHEILDPFLQQYGFESVDVKRDLLVLYSNGTQTLHFSYWVEDRPHCIVMVSVGLVHGSLDYEPVAALESLTKITDEYAQYWRWEFRDPDSLRHALLRIRDHVLLQHVAHFWQRPDLLRQAIIKLHHKEEAEWVVVDAIG